MKATSRRCMSRRPPCFSLGLLITSFRGLRDAPILAGAFRSPLCGEVSGTEHNIPPNSISRHASASGFREP